jgi:3-hydroxybutyryl-CoA dehydrogenase
MAIKQVGVLGCGLMGAGIAQVTAAAGFRTVVLEVQDDVLKKGLGRIDKFLSDGVAKGKVTEAAKQTTLANLSGTTSYDDLRLVIEAIVENADVKKQAYAQVEAVVGPQCLIASNTSSLCITDLAAATKRPDKVGGLHFFNPVPLMKLVEVIRALTTSDETQAGLVAFARSIGKEPIAAPDRGGFIVNRLLVPYLLDAIRCLEEGLGTVEDIDNGMKLGCGYPMGPFTLLDFVGLDTTYFIANILFEEFRETRFAPPPLLKRMVLAGHLGKKSGRGFYAYAK